MTFVHCHMQWSLTSFVPCIKINTCSPQFLNNFSLITKSSMMDSSVAIFILTQKRKELINYHIFYFRLYLLFCFLLLFLPLFLLLFLSLHFFPYLSFPNHFFPNSFLLFPSFPVLPTLFISFYSFPPFLLLSFNHFPFCCSFMLPLIPIPFFLPPFLSPYITFPPHLPSFNLPLFLSTNLNFQIRIHVNKKFHNINMSILTGSLKSCMARKHSIYLNKINNNKLLTEYLPYPFK